MTGRSVSLKKNASLNMVRQACTLVFPFVMFSYSSHILGARQMGAYTFSQSVVSYFLYLAGLGISDYAVREGAALRSDAGKFQKFADEIFTIQLAAAAAAYGALFVLLCMWERLHPYQYVILIQSLQIGLTAAGADWINTAFEDFFYLTVRYLAAGLLCTAAVLLFVKGPEDLYLYTLVCVLAAAGGNLANLFYVRRYVKLGLTVHLNLKKHLRPVLILFGNSLALVIYLNSDMTILGLLVNDGAVGIYSAATKIYLMTKALINAVIMAAVPRLSHMLAAGRQEDYRRILSKIADMLILLLIPAAAGIFFEAENIIYAVSGSAYLQGASVLKIYSITIIPAVCACFLSYAVLMPHRLEKYFLLAAVCAAVLNIGLNFVLIPALGMHGAALATFAAEMTVAVLAAHFAAGRAGIKICRKDAAAEIIGGAVIGCICLVIGQAGLGRIWELALSAGLSAAGYGAVQAGLGNGTFLGFLKSVFKVE